MKTIQDPLQVLRQYFGYDEFRPGQADVIANTLADKDGFVAMRTGGGKSLCFQIPAICLPGTALVISPLIALMKDQVDALLAKGIPAAALNSNMSNDEVRDTINKARAGEYKLLYIAPERFDSESFVRALNDINVSFIAVDEAHCISVWGHDFRLAYRRLPDALEALSTSMGRRMTVLALTATATPAVREDVATQLRLSNPTQFMLGYDRDNLTLLVRNLERNENKDEALLDYLASRPRGEATIVYSSTIKAMPGIAAAIASSGRTVTLYHGKLDADVRKTNQERFLKGDVEVIVATNAFGMGIDKSNIREVIHYHMPASLENYYQEVGRGGRDGKPARGMLLCQRGADERLQKFFIDGNHPHPMAVRGLHSRFKEQGVRKVEVHRKNITRGLPSTTEFQDEALLRRLKHAGMIEYQLGANFDTWIIDIKNPNAPLDLGDLPDQRRTAEANLDAMLRFTNTQNCRRRELLIHFGEPNPSTNCGMCDRCLDPRKSHQAAGEFKRTPDGNVAEAAVVVLLRLIDGCPRPVTVDQASQILLGARDATLVNEGLTQVEGFGRLKHYNQGKLWAVFAHVSKHGLVALEGGALSLTERGRKAALTGNSSDISTLGGAINGLTNKGTTLGEAARIDLDLKSALIRERLVIARRAGVNPLMVASEAALDSIARLRPASSRSLTKTGLNHAQIERFGDAFVRCVKDHSDGPSIRP